MRRAKIKPIKRLGQNFLKDENILRRIAEAAGIRDDEGVLEIGAGAGNLTKYLCKKAKFVYAIEKDARLCKAAEETLKEFKNIEIICDDILNYPLNAIRYPLKIVGNLPYYITTPIIFKLLQNRQYISDIVIMVQKELAERIVAPAGGKDYGILSCSAQFYAEPAILFHISKKAFYPQPEVDSSLVRIRPLSAPSVYVKDEEKFFRLIKTAFSHRRKTLLNSLSGRNGLGILKEWTEAMLGKAGIDKRRRAETLSLDEFARAANFLL